jgi:hypothetical protein
VLNTIPVFLKFSDLRDAGIVANRTTLARWIKAGRFPRPTRLGPNTVAWEKSAILAHLKTLEQS